MRGLLELLRERPALLVLDNLEAILEPGAPEVRYRAGYEGYGAILKRLAEGAHGGCLLLTSREQPLPAGPGDAAGEGAVRALRLGGLDVDAARALLGGRGLAGDEAAWRALVARYGGNPLALRVVGETIGAVFGGDIAAFLAQETAVYGGVRQLLDEQVGRLSAPEQAILGWLAVEREPVGFAALVDNLGPGVSRAAAVEAVEALRRRSLLEWGAGGVFSLQPVVLEYATARLVEALADEVAAGAPALLLRQPVLKATARDYARRSQERLIARPLLELLAARCGRAEAVEQRLLDLLAGWRGRPAGEQGYGPGNAVNLLRLLRGDLRGLDLSRLALRQAYLQGAEAQGASLTGAHLAEAALPDAFSFPTAVALDAEGGSLAAGTATGAVYLWRAADRVLLLATQAHAGSVMSVALSGDGRALASGGEDGAVALWDVAGDGAPATLRGHTGGVYGVALSADGRLLASGGHDGTVRLWDAASGRPLATMRGHVGMIYGVALSAGGRLLISGGHDGTVRLWDATGGRASTTLRGHGSGVYGVATSGDGALVVSGSEDGAVTLWDAARSRPLATLRGHAGMVYRVALSEDGALAASAGQDGTVRLWDTGSRRLLAALEGHAGPVMGVAISGDGRFVASGGIDGMVRLWGVPDGRALGTVRGHEGGVASVALSENGALGVSGGYDGTIRLWDARNGQSLATLQGHTALVQAVALSEDGRLAASGGLDGTVKLWDTTSGVLLRALRPDRPYERMDITGLSGVTEAQRAALTALGAVERAPASPALSAAIPPAEPPAAVLLAVPDPAPTPEPAAARQSTRPPTNLPPDRSSFVGREADLAALARALDPAAPAGARLVTLSGVAGSGKTRLALTVAETVRDRYDDGVWLVELAPLPADPSPDPTAVAAAMLASLGLREQPGQEASDTLVAHLQARRPLLALDNCEHLTAACAALVARLLGACPHLRILATSQRPLGLAEETVWPVATLASPPPVDGAPTPADLRRLEQADAVRLFVERARAVRPGFALDAGNAASVVEICRRLDGLPLAIELAAARLHVLSVDEVRARLDDRFRLLRRGGRAADRRQALQATLDWSYSLLEGAERTLLRRLAVFAGGWELAAAEAICAGGEVTGEAVLELLDELLDRSLVYVYDAGGEPRYGLLETVRQYGAQQLERAGETEGVRGRHLAWCATLAERAAPALQGPEQAVWLARLGHEGDNLRAALRWALDRGLSTLGLRVAGGLGKFWLRAGHQREGRRWLAAFLALAPIPDDAAAPEARATALEAAAGLAEDAHDFTEATALFAQSEALRRTLGQDEHLAAGLINAGMETRARGDYVRATALLEEGLAQYRRPGGARARHAR